MLWNEWARAAVRSAGRRAAPRGTRLRLRRRPTGCDFGTLSPAGKWPTRAPPADGGRWPVLRQAGGWAPSLPEGRGGCGSPPGTPGDGSHVARLVIGRKSCFVTCWPVGEPSVEAAAASGASLRVQRRDGERACSLPRESGGCALPFGAPGDGSLGAPLCFGRHWRSARTDTSGRRPSEPGPRGGTRLATRGSWSSPPLLASRPPTAARGGAEPPSISGMPAAGPRRAGVLPWTGPRRPSSGTLARSS